VSFSNAVPFLPGILAMTINRIVSQNMYFFFIPGSSPKVRGLNPKSIGRRILFLGPLFERVKSSEKIMQ
jgi:hypothetical protein